MSRFLNETLTDIRHGRESWRVFVAVCAPSFAVAVFIAVLQRAV
jgi:hypothetical protein